MKLRNSKLLFATVTSFWGLSCWNPGLAQTTNDASPQTSARNRDGADGDIIVTARKREETSLEAPVVLSAVGAQEMERRGINGLDAIARAVPQLLSGEGGGTIQGGIIALRGISSPETNPFADQAVSFNVDGVQVARAAVRRLATMDLAQVEVLKGPQALFFGKNSPGGIISMRSADPTSSLKGKLSLGYEANAQEWRGEGFIAGPLTDTLGVRVAGYYSTMRGWVENTVPDGAFLKPDRGYGPYNREYAGRITFKWEPSDRFNARFKLSHNKSRGDDAAANVQYVDCPRGSPFGGGIDDCKPNDKVSVGELGPNFGLVEPEFGDGSTRSRSMQTLASLELNYDLTDEISLASVSGYYKNSFWNRSNYTSSYIPAGPPPVLASVNRYRVRDLSQEIRLSSSFDGPLNFLTGLHYSEGYAETGSVAYRNALAPAYNNKFFLRQEGQAWSVFGQGMWDITPEFSLSAGGRYSHEEKELVDVRQGQPQPLPIATAVTKRKFNNFSPEVTLSYMPTRDLNVFASYKRGFLSGGFNSGAGSFRDDQSYAEERIKGFEAGLKASLLDGALRTNFALYRYEVQGLQVTIGVLSPINNITFQTVRNAASVTTKGAEFDFNYRAPVEGLTIRGALAYNDAKIGDYLSPCFVGQTPGQGCTFNPNPAGIPQSQQLGGQTLFRAPKWSGSTGFDYEVPLGGGLKIALSGDMTFTSKYFTSSDNAPRSTQGSYQLYDASLRLSDESDKWEIALLGRNLSDEYYFVRSSTNIFTGGGTGTAGGFIGDTVASVSRGREIMARVTFRFGG
ncbi:TonB-dependent receptor [Sphingobium sp. 3R8]|uniref:TonB-dependent receptor n=1 Tax=Sphingobium sp. 3R8 TaxID=2874921 RepID=UPI001CCE482A|nr:TonB-dependent receptor [Sphingobium sp. 3R8]MBZ9650272.1 TonB-dependent receptor [Sphingobium sp. 3R8]